VRCSPCPHLTWLPILGLSWCSLAWGETPNAQAQPAATSDSSPASEAVVAPPQGTLSPGVEPSEAQRQEAGERFRRGISFYEEGDYRLALIEFERAYQLVPNYRVLFNISQVAISMGKFAKARIALERYLAEGGASLDAERRAAVERDLNMLRGRTATLTIEAEPADAEARVDEQIVGNTPFHDPLILEAGEHRVRLRKKGFLSEERSFTLAGGESLTLKLGLEAEPEAPPVVVVERPSERSKAEISSPIRSARWVSWTLTGVLAGGALVTGLVGADLAGDLNRMKSQPNPDPGELNQTSADAQTWLVTSDVLMIAAGTALGTSIFLQLYHPEPRHEVAKPKSVGVALFPTPGGVGVRGHF
jgi:hypothetical protein